MENIYIENLIEKIQDGKKVEHGTQSIVWAYESAKRRGFDVLTWSEVMWEKDVESIVETLRAAGINELYITSQASNMLGVYLMLDELGLKLRGVVRLENPAYKQDMERWGSSCESETIPAMKLSFEEV